MFPGKPASGQRMSTIALVIVGKYRVVYVLIKILSALLDTLLLITTTPLPNTSVKIRLVHALVCTVDATHCPYVLCISHAFVL